MNSRALLIPVAFICALLGGCASSFTSSTSATGGPVATIIGDETRQVRVVSVDGRAVSGSGREIRLQPGTRTIEVTYHPPKTAHSYPVRITFNAEAGHLYALSAKVLGGNEPGTGYWEGKYQAFIYDLNPVHEVGRSAGPAAPNAGD